MKDKFIPTLLIIGVIVTAYILVFDWEYKLIEAEMGLIGTLLLSSPDDPAGLVRQGSVASYLAQMVFWSLFLIGLGMVWSNVLFPKRSLMEKVVFSLCFGVLVMPVSFVLPAFIISAGKVIGETIGTGVPGYYGPVVGQIIDLISANEEQGYEIANVLIFFVIGFALLAIKSMKKKTTT